MKTAHNLFRLTLAVMGFCLMLSLAIFLIVASQNPAPALIVCLAVGYAFAGLYRMIRGMFGAEGCESPS